jgi:hypothetical protein
MDEVFDSVPCGDGFGLHALVEVVAEYLILSDGLLERFQEEHEAREGRSVHGEWVVNIAEQACRVEEADRELRVEAVIGNARWAATGEAPVAFNL